MKLVFAGSSNKPLNEVLRAERVSHLLCSMLFLKSFVAIDYRPDYFLLDSGAFSVWKSGETVQLDNYIAVARQQCEKWPHTVVINLDVIPGAPGRPATAQETTQAMADSLKNADRLRAEGFDAMEVFHMGEPFDFLDHLLDRRPNERTILGISPRKDQGQKKQEEWLKAVLGHCIRRFGVKHLPRTHGLGVTNPDLVRAFPFYSCDSTSWANPQIWGQRLTDKGRLELIDKTLGKGASRSKACVRLHVHQAVQGYKRIENETTRLWETRGVHWID
jgi:hypothetical protein